MQKKVVRLVDAVYAWQKDFPSSVTPPPHLPKERGAETRFARQQLLCLPCNHHRLQRFDPNLRQNSQQMMLMLHCLLDMQSKEEMGGTGTTDLKAAAQGLRLPSPNTALPPPGAPSAFQAPRNEDWRSKFRSSDSFTSDRGTPVCCCSLCIAVDICCGVCCWHALLAFGVGAGCVFCFWRSAAGICCGACCWHALLAFAVSAECVFCFWHSAVYVCCGVASDSHTHELIVVACGHKPSMSA